MRTLLWWLLLCSVAMAQGTAILPKTSILPKTTIIKPGGGTSTITFVGTGTQPCYSATTCTLSGLSVGDRVDAYIGDNGADTLTCSSGCSSSGAFPTPYNDASSNANHIGGMWGIANASSVTFTWNVHAGSDTGITLLGLHSTTGWNTASFVQGTPATAPNNTSGNSLVLPATTPTSVNNAVTCYVLQEALGFTASAITQSFSTGPAATGHSDASFYLLNAAASTFNPTVTVSTVTGYGAMCGAMGTN